MAHLIRHRVRVELAVYHTTGADSEIVHIGDPLLRVAETPPLGAYALSATKLKSSGPFTGPNVNPTGKYLPDRATIARTSRARFVLRIWLKPLTASTNVYHTLDPDRRGEHVSAPPAVVRRPLSASVNAAVVHYQAALPRPLVVGHLLRREGSRAPGGRSAAADQLAP